MATLESSEDSNEKDRDQVVKLSPQHKMLMSGSNLIADSDEIDDLVATPLKRSSPRKTLHLGTDLRIEV